MCMHMHRLSWRGQTSAQLGPGRPSLPILSAAQQVTLSAVKADKHQEQQRGPSPRSWTLSLKRETHWEPDQCRGAAFNSDAPAAGLCMPRAGNAQSWRWEFALPGSAHSSLPTGQLGEQNRHGHAENGEGAKAAVQRSHTHATTTERRGQKKRCVATKAESITRSPSHHSGRASKERKKKKSLRTRNH